MKKRVYSSLLISFILISLLNACSSGADIEPEPEPEKPVEVPLEKEGYVLLLNEEFEQESSSGLTLPVSHWLIYKNGWKESLASVADGKLVLDAVILKDEENFSGKTYSNKEIDYRTTQVGGVIHSQEHYMLNKGYLEVKARFPEGGENLLPAIKIMSSDWGNWPSGFDAFEVSQGLSNTLFIKSFSMASVYESSASSRSPEISTSVEPSASFHTYGIEWMPGQVKYYFDGKWVGSENAFWLGEETMVYFLISLGLDEDARAPDRGMEVEYIRWYKKAE